MTTTTRAGLGLALPVSAPEWTHAAAGRRRFPWVMALAKRLGSILCMVTALGAAALTCVLNGGIAHPLLGLSGLGLLGLALLSWGCRTAQGWLLPVGLGVITASVLLNALWPQPVLMLIILFSISLGPWRAWARSTLRLRGGSVMRVALVCTALLMGAAGYTSIGASEAWTAPVGGTLKR